MRTPSSVSINRPYVPTLNRPYTASITLTRKFSFAVCIYHRTHPPLPEQLFDWINTILYRGVPDRQPAITELHGPSFVYEVRWNNKRTARSRPTPSYYHTKRIRVRSDWKVLTVLAFCGKVTRRLIFGLTTHAWYPV